MRLSIIPLMALSACGCQFDTSMDFFKVVDECPGGNKIFRHEPDATGEFSCEKMQEELHRATPVMTRILGGKWYRALEILHVKVYPEWAPPLVGYQGETIEVAGFSACEGGVINVSTTNYKTWRAGALVHETVHIATDCFALDPKPDPAIDELGDPHHANWTSTGILRAVEGLASGRDWASKLKGPDFVLDLLPEE